MGGTGQRLYPDGDGGAIAPEQYPPLEPQCGAEGLHHTDAELQPENGPHPHSTQSVTEAGPYESWHLRVSENGDGSGKWDQREIASFRPGRRVCPDDNLPRARDLRSLC